MRHIRFWEVPVWWLIYRRDDKIVGIAIVEAPSLYHARMRAAVAGIGKATDFSEGLEIDAAHAGAIRLHHCRRYLILRRFPLKLNLGPPGERKRKPEHVAAH